MRIFTFIIAILFSTFQLQSQDGTLITLFGDNGIAIHPILSGDSELYDVVYYNGAYYAVGYAEVDDRAECLIIKTDSKGNLISNFGTDGFISIPKGSGFSEFTKIEISNDGKLLASGWILHIPDSMMK